MIIHLKEKSWDNCICYITPKIGRTCIVHSCLGKTLRLYHVDTNFDSIRCQDCFDLVINIPIVEIVEMTQDCSELWIELVK